MRRNHGSSGCGPNRKGAICARSKRFYVFEQAIEGATNHPRGNAQLRRLALVRRASSSTRLQRRAERRVARFHPIATCHRLGPPRSADTSGQTRRWGVATRRAKSRQSARGLCKQEAARPPLLRSKKPLEFRSHDTITFAGPLLQGLAIANRDMSAPIFDQSASLQISQDDSNAGAPGTEHL